MNLSSPFIVVILVCGGIGLLVASLLPVRHILGMIRTGPLRRNWLVLATLIVLFLPGYATFGWMCGRHPATGTDVMVAGILFLGACFVVGVAHLSRQTAGSLLRVARLERDALIDPLTQLSNRRYLSHRFTEEIARAQRYHLSLSVVLLDIDHFKKVNDVYGHRAGDEVLQGIARAMERELRSSDIAVRYGGDEILVIATNTDASTATVLAERLRRAIGEKARACEGAASIAITVSIGVATLLAEECACALIDRVDRALYAAKEQGRDRVCAAPCGEVLAADTRAAGSGVAEALSR